MVALLLGSPLTAKGMEQSSFSVCLCVKVEACDTNKWVPHGRDAQEQVSVMKGII